MERKKKVFGVVTPVRTYYMKATTEQEARDWVNAIKSAVTPVQTRAPSNTNQANLLRASGPVKRVAIEVNVGDFQKLKVVGKGAFGKVFLVKKKDTGKAFAMKQLDIAFIKERDEVEHTLAERRILSKSHHPFINSLHYSFRTPSYLYLVMDFVNGGELFHHLSQERSFPEERAKFYAAEITLGLGYLHANGIIYRDLKPENLLLDYKGHIIITDFGLSKEGLHNDSDKTTTFCGTPEYLAPEIIRGEEYNKPVDWWSLGILIFEMMTGLPPFYSKREELMYQRIVTEDISFPDVFSANAQDIVKKLLDRNPETRLKENEIKAHPYFGNIDWERLFNREIQPPFVPNVQSPDDVANIDDEFLDESVSSGEEDVRGRKESSFAGFTYQKDE